MPLPHASVPIGLEEKNHLLKILYLRKGDQDFMDGRISRRNADLDQDLRMRGLSGGMQILSRI